MRTVALRAFAYRSSRRYKGALFRRSLGEDALSAIARGSRPQDDHNPAAPHLLLLLRPPCDQADALLPKIGARLGAAHAAMVDIRELAFDDV